MSWLENGEIRGDLSARKDSSWGKFPRKTGVGAFPRSICVLSQAKTKLALTKHQQFPTLCNLP